MTDNRYGWYRYGEHEFRPDESLGDDDTGKDTGPTPRDVFGEGVALRSVDDPGGVPWDFVADATGDLATSAGYSEFAKDLAFMTATDASSVLGTRGTANDLDSLERQIERTAQSNEYIRNVRATVEIGATRKIPEYTDETSVVEAQLDVSTENETVEGLTVPLQRYLGTGGGD